MEAEFSERIKTVYRRNHGWKGFLPIALLAFILFGQGFVIKSSLRLAKVSREAFTLFVYGKNQ